MNKDKSLYTLEMDSVAPLVEDLLLTTKTTAGPDGTVSETGDMSDLNMSSIPEDGMDFRLRKCLSPLETDEKDIPTNEPSEPSQAELSKTHKQEPNAKKSPLLLSESSSKLDFPLGSVIDSSWSHPCLDPNGSQDQSNPEKQELKTHRDITTEYVSCVAQANIIGELPKQRMTRRRLASQRLKESQESRAQTRLSKTKSDDKEPTCGNVHLKTPNSRGVRTQMSTPLKPNRKTVAGKKRKQENCLPRTKKMCLNTASKQHEHDAYLPKVQVTVGTVKRGRGRPPKSKIRSEKIEQKCDNAKKMCRAVLEQHDKKEPNTREEDSTEMREADVNGNFVQTKQNVFLDQKYSGQAKRSSIIDKVFHKTGNACRNPFGLQLTANPHGTTCSSQRLQGAVEKTGECGNLVNDIEYIRKSVCGENEAVMSVVENKDAVDNQVRLQMSHKSTSHIVHRTVEKRGRPAVEENSGREATFLQCDFQNVMDISVAPLTSENLTKDVTDVDRAMSPTETGSSANNKPIVMERIDMTRNIQERHTSVCINPESENVGEKNEAAVSIEQEFLENNENGDLGRCKVVQPTKETIENEEPEIQMTNDEAVQEIAQCASDVGNKKSDYIDLNGGRYSSETLLEEDKLSTGYTAGGRMTDDSSNAAMALRGTQVIVKSGPNVQTGDVSNKSTVTEDCSTLHIAVSSSDEEVIEVDVLEHSLFSNSPLLLLAAAQTISLPIEDLQDQDVELDVTEEEEVDVTGEDTDKEDL